MVIYQQAGGFFKSSTNIKGFQKMQSNLTSPLRNFVRSVPNLKDSLKLKESTPTIKIAASSNTLPISRSQSLSCLAKGSSGSITKFSNIKGSNSLQKWISSAGNHNVQETSPPSVQEKMDISEIDSKDNIPLPKPIFQSPNGVAAVTSFTDNIEIDDDTPCSMPSPDCTNAEVKIDLESSDNQANTPINRFNFARACKSPEDDFQFPTYVFSKSSKMEERTADTDSSMPSFLGSDGNPFGIFGMVSPSTKSPDEEYEKADFQFAVPSAPPPGSTKNRQLTKGETNSAETNTIFSKMMWSDSPQTPKENAAHQLGFFALSPDCKDANKNEKPLMPPSPGMPFSFCSNEGGNITPSESGFALLENSEEDSAMETSKDTFAGFGSFDTSKSRFESMFKFGDS
uniref:uncharacterized protein LOC120345286 n=1 Tax=Styela clava TaxID=7725 RepID=UPI001939DADC|nr:uncharacterized protein LOC120345286 [Styela clava]